MLGLTDNQKGFTMLELVISIAILAMIILPISGFFVNSVKTTKSAEEVLLASQLAQKYLESYKVKGVNGIGGIKNIGENGSMTIDESGYTVKISRGSNVAVNDYPGGIKMTDMDLKIDVETNGNNQIDFNSTSFSISSDNLLKLTVNESIGGLDITLTHNAIAYAIPQKAKRDIKLAMICSGESALKLDVYNNTAYNTDIYRVINNGSNDVTMSIQAGRASLINNNYTDTQDFNYMCPLTITVSKKGKVLAENNVLIR